MAVSPLSVLVVDDEPALREVLSLRIEDWGYHVSTAADAHDAERLIEESRPDLVLSDVVLPGTSGVELLKRLKQHDDSLPVILITAHGNIAQVPTELRSYLPWPPTNAAKCSPVSVDRPATRSAGVPSNTTRPPSCPAPGPRSMIQSACAITAW